MWLSTRSYEKEFLDLDDIKSTDLNRNLYELDVINNRLGGYNASRKGIATILKTDPDLHTILDIGFGGGDSIKQLAEFSYKNNKEIFFYGVDMKADCVKYAEANLTGLKNKLLICDDYRNMTEEFLKKIDVIHCSLFLHHLTDEEIVDLFKFCKKNNCIILANDLHRHWLAYYSIKLLTSLFSSSYLVKNDAPLSVKRGFKKNELILFLKRAGYINYSVTWSWAFRYIITAKP